MTGSAMRCVSEMGFKNTGPPRRLWTLYSHQDCGLSEASRISYHGGWNRSSAARTAYKNMILLWLRLTFVLLRFTLWASRLHLTPRPSLFQGPLKQIPLICVCFFSFTFRVRLHPFLFVSVTCRAGFLIPQKDRFGTRERMHVCVWLRLCVGACAFFCGFYRGNHGRWRQPSRSMIHPHAWPLVLFLT